MSANQLKYFSPPDGGLADSADDAPRLLLGLDGRVIYASAGLSRLCGGFDPSGRDFLTLAAFADPDNAFRHSPLLFATGNDIFAGLRPGLHEVIFTQGGERARLQFDLVKAANGTRYAIASAIEADADFERDVDIIINRGDAQAAGGVAHFLELSSDALCIAEAGGAFESINEIFELQLGYRLADLSGRSFVDIVHPDDRAAVRASLQALVHDESGLAVMDFECRLLSRDAQSLWYSWKHKKADGRLYSAGRDITAAKRHEQALLRREQQLSEAEAIGRIGHWHWALGEQELRFSDQIYRIFGVERDSFTPTFDAVNALIDRADAGRMGQAFERAVIEQADHDIDFQIRTRSGDIRHVKCQGRCEFDAAGDVTGLYGIMQDVTDVMKHEQELLASKDSVERAYAAKSQFLANMSHELRTPLNAIIGFSEMMQQQLLGPIGNERYLDYIKGIRESGEHLLDLITDILDMSKIEAGKYELDLEHLNVVKVLRLAVHMVEGRAGENGIKIRADIPEETINIVADRRAVMQITLNLLSNAVKFSHANSVIDLELSLVPDGVVMRVRDRGIGIPSHKLPTITNPFEQAANQYTRSHQGSGLGLSITKELTELHGGTLQIESAVDVGTTVTIRLPLDASRR